MSSIASPATPWLDGRYQPRIFDTPPMSPPLDGRFCWESPYNNVYASAWWMNLTSRSRYNLNDKATPGRSPKDTTEFLIHDDKIEFLSLSASPGLSECSSNTQSTNEDETMVDEQSSVIASSDSQWAVIQKMVYEAIGGPEQDAEIEAQELVETIVEEELSTTTSSQPDFCDSVVPIVKLPRVSLPAKPPVLPDISDLKISTDLEALNPEQVTTARNVCMWGRRLERIPKVRVPGQADAVYCFDPKRLAPKMERLLRVKYGNLQGLPGGGKGRVGLPVGTVIERKMFNGNDVMTRLPIGNVKAGYGSITNWRANVAGNGQGQNRSTLHHPPTTPKPAFNTRNFPSLPSTVSTSPPTASYPAFASYTRFSPNWTRSDTTKLGMSSQPVTPSPCSRVSYSNATMRPKQTLAGDGFLHGDLGANSAAAKMNSIMSWRRLGSGSPQVATIMTRGSVVV